MTRDSDALQIEKWAASGDVATPESQGLTRASGWPVAYSQAGSGKTPEREVVNQLFRELTALAVELNTRGLLEWDSSVSYVHPALVVGSDGRPYRSVRNSQGVDPTTDTGDDWRRRMDLIAEWPAHGLLAGGRGTQIAAARGPLPLTGSYAGFVHEFAADTAQAVYGQVQAPSSFQNDADPAVTITWSTPATTGDVRWEIGVNVVSDGDAILSPTLSRTETLETVPTTADTKATATVTVSGLTYAATDLLIVTISRNGAHADNTATDVAHLYHVTLEAG